MFVFIENQKEAVIIYSLIALISDWNLKMFVGKFIKYLIFLAVFCMNFDANAKTEYLTIDGDHGKLSALLQTPNGANKYPVVMILHGFMANKSFPLFPKIADNLEKAGIASIRFDFNAHGQSEGKFVDMTVPNEIEDAKKVFNYLQKLPEVTSISVVGHSQGGLVAGLLAGELGKDKIESVCLLAPASFLQEAARKGNLFGISYDLEKLPDYITLYNGNRLGKEYIETMRNLPIYEMTKEYTGPVYIINGRDDKLVPYKYAEEYDENYQNSKLEILDGFDHNFNPDMTYVANLVSNWFISVLNK